MATAGLRLNLQQDGPSDEKNRSGRTADRRERVIEMTQRVGVKGIRKTCSMALGDYGITPLEHTGGAAVFANGGKRALPSP